MMISEEIREFIRNYVTALERLVEKKRHQIESTNIKPSFPTQFPIAAIVCISKRGIFINYFKADHFDVFIRKDEKPHEKGKWKEFIPYPLFERIKNRAFEKAKSDIERFLNFPETLEELERETQNYYENLWMEDMRYTIEHYIEFLNQSKEVLKKTKDEAIQEVYDIIELIQNHLLNFECILQAGCEALTRTYFMINSDMETSFFLALHGKYNSAIAHLRKVLEVYVRCIYLDSFLDRRVAEKKLNEWLNEGRFKEKFRKIVNYLISDEIDKGVTSLLEQYSMLDNESFKNSILFLYQELCGFVHLRPPTARRDDLILSFSEFSLSNFRKYHATLKKVVKLAEILLVLKIPKIISTQRFSNSTVTYMGLILSKQELENIAKMFISSS